MSRIDIKVEADVDFEFFSLKFNKYELEDGTILKMTEIVEKVLKIDQRDLQGRPQYIIVTKNIISAQVPENLKGTPSNEVFDPHKDPMDPIEFNPVIEPWNNYELADGTLMKVRVIVERVYRAQKCNQLKEPIYWVTKHIAYNFKFNN